MCLNHPKQTPNPSPWKTYLLWNWSLVQKRLETTALVHPYPTPWPPHTWTHTTRKMNLCSLSGWPPFSPFQPKLPSLVTVRYFLLLGALSSPRLKCRSVTRSSLAVGPDVTYFPASMSLSVPWGGILIFPEWDSYFPRVHRSHPARWEYWSPSSRVRHLMTLQSVMSIPMIALGQGLGCHMNQRGLPWWLRQ